MTSGDDGRGSDRRPSPGRVPTILRFVALGLLLVGFVGAVDAGVSPIAGDSRYSVAFYAGIACAIASIYLAIFLRDD